jgi:twitching motility protein PilT
VGAWRRRGEEIARYGEAVDDSGDPSGVDALLERLWRAGGTDLLLTSGAPPLLRVDGQLTRPEDLPALSAPRVTELAHRLLNDRQVNQLARGTEIDFSFSWRGAARVRGNAFRQRGDTAVALRMIPRQIPGFDDLRLPVAVRDLARLTQGLVFVTGPTGSGKSTTLASLVDWINANRAVHILTIEDPIEYVHDHKRSAVNQREVGEDTDTFSHALRSALREDPDVILVGEVRDLESIRFALTLAETGHLVFATLHTNDTTQAVDRLIDVFPADQQPQIRVQLANALTGIVHQRLLPRVTGGMVAAYEVLVATSAIRNLVKGGKTNQLRNQVLTGQRDGMQTLEMSLTELVAAGIVRHGEAVARAAYPGEVAAPPS